MNTRNSGINIDVYKDGFTAMAVKSGFVMKDKSIAGGGLIWPSLIAEHYLEMSFDYARIAAYCLRRFGYSVIGYDDDKQLYSWLVTTPMDGVFLRIDASSVGPFGYGVTREIEHELLKEHFEYWTQRNRDIKQWAKDKYGITLIDYMRFANSDKEIEEEFNQWGNRTYGDIFNRCKTVEQLAEIIDSTGKEICDRFHHEKSSEAKVIDDEYKEIYPHNKNESAKYDFPYYELKRIERWLNIIGYRCRKIKQRRLGRLFYWMSGKFSGYFKKKFYQEIYWFKLPESSITRQVNEAIYRTLQDLRRPVAIRDWGFNIEGEHPNGYEEYDEDGELVYDYTAPVFEKAGWGVYLETIANESWSKVVAILENKYGNLETGIEKLLEILDDSDRS